MTPAAPISAKREEAALLEVEAGAEVEAFDVLLFKTQYAAPIGEINWV